jgi:hypothetical protein
MHSMTTDGQFGESGLVKFVDLSRFHRISKGPEKSYLDWERNVNSFQTRNQACREKVGMRFEPEKKMQSAYRLL